jgi:hypothetical protein
MYTYSTELVLVLLVHPNCVVERSAQTNIQPWKPRRVAATNSRMFSAVCGTLCVPSMAE